MPHDVYYDFHMHTTLSDGVLSAVELIRRNVVNGCAGLVIADHSGPGTLERFVRENGADCAVAREFWGIPAYPGVELTHVPAASIPALARRAKDLGAALVVVHGQSPVEPVEPGTNLHAASCPDVDILAHPGLLTEDEARAASENGVFIEISARKGHSMANGHIVRVALAHGARLVVDSDAHTPDNILTPSWAEHVARCAGIAENLLDAVLIDGPRELLQRAQSNARDESW